MTILLVDDSRTLLMTMRAMLTKAGYAVEEAQSGPAALARIDAGLKPALVITDLNMPEMDGISLIKRLRQTPSLRFTPILMLTTESQQTKRKEARAAGATGWLVKPVPAADLLQVVGKVLSN